VLFQLARDDFGIIVPDIAGNGYELVTVESLKTSLGIRPAQVPSFLALTEGGKKPVLTKRQAIRLLELHDDLEDLLQDTSAVSSHPIRRQLSANEKVLLARLCDMKLEKGVCQPAAFTESQLAFIRNNEESAGFLRECGFWSLVRLLPPARPTTTGVLVSVK